MISSLSLLSFSADTDAKIHENDQVCVREQPYTPLDLKIHLKLIPSNWFGCLQKWETWIRIRLNSLSPYLLLVVSSPIFSSLLFSSSHALSACREISPPFSPLAQSFRLCPSFPADALASQMSQQKGFFFCFPLFSAAPPQLSDIHPLRSGCALGFERTAGAAGQNRGKRRSGGVEKAGRGGCGTWGGGQRTRDSRKEPEVCPQSRSGTGLIQNHKRE